MNSKKVWVVLSVGRYDDWTAVQSVFDNEASAHKCEQFLENSLEHKYLNANFVVEEHELLTDFKL